MRPFTIAALLALAAVPAEAGRGKVDICHQGRTLSVAENAVPAHLRHGDHLPLTGYGDRDGDGFGDAGRPVTACVLPAGVVADRSDCNDADTTIHPGAVERCDDVDRDCDGVAGEGAPSIGPEGELLGADCVIPADVVAQQALWVAHGRVAPECVWEELEVGAGIDLSARLAVPTCGRVVRLGDGVFAAGPVEITAPTIIMGSGQTTVVGTLMVRAGVPLRVDDVTFEEAPYPGAVFVSHPDADVTLRKVTINGASGYGVFQHGGNLRMVDATITNTRAGVGRLPEGAGIVAEGARAIVAGPYTLVEVVVPPIFIGRGWEAMMQTWIEASLPDLNAGWAPIDPPIGGCGTAAIFVGPNTYAEIVGPYITHSEGAAILVSGEGAAAVATWPALVENGYEPNVAGSMIDYLIPSCMGAIHVSDGATLTIQGGQLLDSRRIGALVAEGAYLFGRSLKVVYSSGPLPGDVGDGFIVLKSAFLDLDQSTVDFIDRAGVLFSKSTGNLTDVQVQGGTYGLVLQEGSAPAYDSDCIFEGSTTNILSDGALPVPNAPLAIPEAP